MPFIVCLSLPHLKFLFVCLFVIPGKPIYREFAAPVPTDGFLEATRQVGGGGRGAGTRHILYT